MSEEVEIPLFICREVGVYKIPPRPPTGHLSGDWKVTDKIADCRLRVVGRGDGSVVYLDDLSSGDLFAICPVPYGMRLAAVEQAKDSSRYFVLRIEDPASGRHAFIGMGFLDRNDAFDFNVSLTDQEHRTEMRLNPAVVHHFDDGAVKEAQHPLELQTASYGDEDGPPGHLPAAPPPPAPDGPSAPADYGLKQGQKIHINISKPLSKAPMPGSGFISGALQQGRLPTIQLNMAGARPAQQPPSTSAPADGGGYPQAPPQQQQQQYTGGYAAPPAQHAQQPQDLLGFDDWGTPSGAAAPPTQQPSQGGSWTTFE